MLWKHPHALLINIMRIHVSELVERIIGKQELADQFSDSPLTFRDLSEIKKIFRKRLLNIHHVRTVYPEIDSGDS